MELETTKVVKMKFKPNDTIPKSSLTKILAEYFKQNFMDSSDSHLIEYVFRRYSRPAKELFLICKSEDEAINAIRWAAKKFGDKKLNWSLETVIKYIPQYMSEGRKSNRVKELEERLR